MAYKSLRKAVDMNLDRKCRILFFICLTVLISGAFIWVDYKVRGIIDVSTTDKAGSLVTASLFRAHMVAFETSPEPSMREYIDKLSVDFQGQKTFKTEIVTLDPTYPILYLPRLRAATDDRERDLLLELLNKHKEEKLRNEVEAMKISAENGPSEGDESDQELTRDGILAAPRSSVSVDYLDKATGDYHYYEPLQWTANCKTCHIPTHESGGLSTADVGSVSTAQQPMQVIKVVMPYAETRSAISQAQSILISVAFVTVTASMLGLYLIVNFVILKPLRHLRDVSDEISRGNTQLRAEVDTNDEFEELATAFNRMLHHLMDAQGELKQVNTELDSRVDQLAQLNMRLYEMNRLKDDFLANMSHELRTPLNSIIGFSDVLQNIDSLDDKQKRYAQNIQKSGRLLLEMINDILDLAKMEAGKMELRPTEFQLHTIVHAQCDMVRSLTDEKQIDLEVDVSEDLHPIYQDQAKIQQVLTNLLSNAIKFTPEGGRINVVARRNERDNLEMTVQDTGVGIPAEDRDVIFEKFRQSTIVEQDGLTREYSGTGLGLSIIKELCKLMGGQISFESEVGKGSTFRIVVPWNASVQPQFHSELNAKLKELTKPNREDFQATSTGPAVAATAE